jgi:hypothetical protein
VSAGQFSYETDRDLNGTAKGRTTFVSTCGTSDSTVKKFMPPPNLVGAGALGMTSPASDKPSSALDFACVAFKHSIFIESLVPNECAPQRDVINSNQPTVHVDAALKVRQVEKHPPRDEVERLRQDWQNKRR